MSLSVSRSRLAHDFSKSLIYLTSLFGSLWLIASQCSAIHSDFHASYRSCILIGFHLAKLQAPLSLAPSYSFSLPSLWAHTRPPSQSLCVPVPFPLPSPSTTRLSRTLSSCCPSCLVASLPVPCCLCPCSCCRLRSGSSINVSSHGPHTWHSESSRTACSPSPSVPVLSALHLFVSITRFFRLQLCLFCVFLSS